MFHQHMMEQTGKSVNCFEGMLYVISQFLILIKTIWFSPEWQRFWLKWMVYLGERSSLLSQLCQWKWKKSFYRRQPQPKPQPQTHNKMVSKKTTNQVFTVTCQDYLMSHVFWQLVSYSHSRTVVLLSFLPSWYYNVTDMQCRVMLLLQNKLSDRTTNCLSCILGAFQVCRSLVCIICFHCTLYMFSSKWCGYQKRQDFERRG